jgi:hypothetical protein
MQTVRPTLVLLMHSLNGPLLAIRRNDDAKVA